MGIGNKMQGLMGNLSEIDAEKLKMQYGNYLMDEENIYVGFILIRDIVLFTDKRIIEIDRQGVTGQKERVKSIYLDSVIRVSAETAGFGMDDCELAIEYISSPYFRASAGITLSQLHYEFPKKYQIQNLYRWLQEVAYKNHTDINK